MSNIHLEPCPTPWCTHHAPGFTTDSVGRFQVVCVFCRVRGPVAVTKEAAAEAWSTRCTVPVEALRELRDNWLLDFHARPCASELTKLIDQAERREGGDVSD